MAHPSFQQFGEQWHAVAHSRQSSTTLGALAEAEPCIAALPFCDLGELVDAVRGSARSLDLVTADRVVGAMVASQGADPLIGVAVVAALAPGLITLARRLSFGVDGPWGHPETFVGDLLTTAWEVVADWAGRRREYMAPALLGAVRKRLSRKAQSWHREQSVRADEAEVADLPGVSMSTAELLARALADATGRTLAVSEAAIVYSSRVLGMPLVELAARTGQSRQALDRRRCAAETRLCRA